jgi:pyruvate/2-oxoacid:ferredoxin oxidoreductase alpha subunit
MNPTRIQNERPTIKPVKKTARFPGQRPEVLKGNIAAAEAARLCRVGFVPAYPITPQTSIVEKLSDMVASGELDATYINMDSEHSVFAAAMGASLGGERVFTATAGQGLFYAHEVLQAIAHFRLPMVVCNVGRPSIPWNIWSDQSDSLSQRDTGWIQYYGESAQEVLDTIIQGYRLTEALNIPVLVVLDAFYQSHTSENVWVPGQEMVDDFLPPPPPRGMQIDLSDPKAFGGLIGPEHYNKLNYAYWRDIGRVETLSEKIAGEFAAQFGRSYHNVEVVNIWPDTRLVLITLSSITTTVRGVLQCHPEVGLLKVRLMHPFPQASVRRALALLSKKAVIACVERNYLGGREGALYQEMRRTLYGYPNPIYDFFAGVGGKDVPPETIEKIIDLALHDPEPVCWVDV